MERLVWGYGTFGMELSSSSPIVWTYESPTERSRLPRGLHSLMKEQCVVNFLRQYWNFASATEHMTSKTFEDCTCFRRSGILLKGQIFLSGTKQPQHTSRLAQVWGHCHVSSYAPTGCKGHVFFRLVYQLELSPESFAWHPSKVHLPELYTQTQLVNLVKWRTISNNTCVYLMEIKLSKNNPYQLVLGFVH